MSNTVIYRTRRILTMNPANPEATHVAVRDGRMAVRVQKPSILVAPAP